MAAQLSPLLVQVRLDPGEGLVSSVRRLAVANHLPDGEFAAVLSREGDSAASFDRLGRVVFPFGEPACDHAALHVPHTPDHGHPAGGVICRAVSPARW